MARADLFVLSSLWEGSANVVAEALACGVPVVATSCPGGARELLGIPPEIDRSDYGRIVPCDSIPALTSAITLALSAPEPGARARARVRAASFDLPLIITSYLQVLGLSTAFPRETMRDEM